MPKSKVPSRKADHAGHLRRYLMEVDQGEESGQPTGRIIASPAAQLMTNINQSASRRNSSGWLRLRLG